jgi:hypothetical protein
MGYGAKFNDDITASDAAILYNSVVGISSDYSDVFAPQITIANSHLNVDELKGVNNAAADSVTITNTASNSPVNVIKTKALSVSGSAIEVNTVTADIATISSGSYGSITLSGSGASTISGGTFKASYLTASDGKFVYNGTGTLNVTGGSFNGTTSLYSGSGQLNGTCPVSGSNATLYFADLDILGGDWVIKSAKLKATTINQLNSIGTHISQDSYDDDKFVYIDYAANLAGGAATVGSSTPLEKIKLNFSGPTNSTYTSLTVSTTLTLGTGVIVSGHVYATDNGTNDPVLVSINKSISGFVYNATTDWTSNYAPEKVVGNEYWYRHDTW